MADEAEDAIDNPTRSHSPVVPSKRVDLSRSTALESTTESICLLARGSRTRKARAELIQRILSGELLLVTWDAIVSTTVSGAADRVFCSHSALWCSATKDLLVNNLAISIVKGMATEGFLHNSGVIAEEISCIRVKAVFGCVLVKSMARKEQSVR